MHTDMTKHFEMVEKFKTRDPKALILPSGKRKPDLELMGYLTHCADLSNGLRIPPISKKWTILVDQEFKEQVAEEKELGMPLSMFLYAENTSQLAKREANFIGMFDQCFYPELLARAHCYAFMVQYQRSLSSRRQV
jgi:hypothetical protein